jgi:uncharacterized protein YggL (DUF469 family)
MTLKQKLNLREMQMVVVQICMKYPNDADRIEKALIVMENFIDNCINEALGIAITKNSALYSDGRKKN